MAQGRGHPRDPGALGIWRCLRSWGAAGAAGRSCLAPAGSGLAAAGPEGARRPGPRLLPALAPQKWEAGGREAAAGEGRGRLPGARGALGGRGSVAFLVSTFPLLLSWCPPSPRPPPSYGEQPPDALVGRLAAARRGLTWLR